MAFTDDKSRYRESVAMARLTAFHQSSNLVPTKGECAENMLKFTDLPIQEVAEICGYSSLQYFYAVFKKAHYRIQKEFREQFPVY